MVILIHSSLIRFKCLIGVIWISTFPCQLFSFIYHGHFAIFALDWFLVTKTENKTMDATNFKNHKPEVVEKFEYMLR